MEASALQAPATLPQTRVAIAAPLLRLRSDEQLVALFRAGHDEAFRAIHDRYNKRLFAYARQMLPGRQDAEDALQDVFVRAYSGLRATDNQFALRAWLFRVAHNRCIDELRRPTPPPPEVLQLVRTTVHDPLVEVDLRESLRRLVQDIRRLPEQQRSALLMRELAGMSYADLATSLGISVGAVKSLLVRARVALAQAAEARDTSCRLIREQLVEAHDRGLRPCATARRHMRDCVACKSFRRELRGMSRQLAAFTPAMGPLGIVAKLGFSGGAGGGAAGGGGLALLGGGGATASAGGVAVGVNHLATLLVAAAATAGGAVEIQHTIIPPAHHRAQASAIGHGHHGAPSAASAGHTAGIQAIAGDVERTVSSAPTLAATADSPGTLPVKLHHHKVTAGGAGLTPATGTKIPVGSSKTKTSKADGTSSTSATSSGSSTAAGGACAPLSTSGSTTGTGSTTTSSTTGSTTQTQSTTPGVASTCASTNSPSSGTSSSTTSTGTSGTATGTGGSTSGTGDPSSGGTSTPGSDPGTSSSTGGSTGGSSTAPK